MNQPSQAFLEISHDHEGILTSQPLHALKVFETLAKTRSYDSAIAGMERAVHYMRPQVRIFYLDALIRLCDDYGFDARTPKDIKQRTSRGIELYKTAVSKKIALKSQHGGHLRNIPEEITEDLFEDYYRAFNTDQLTIAYQMDAVKIGIYCQKWKEITSIGHAFQKFSAPISLGSGRTLGYMTGRIIAAHRALDQPMQALEFEESLSNKNITPTHFDFR